MKINDKDFEITDTVEIDPITDDKIGNNRFKLDSVKRNLRTRVFSTLVLLVLLLGFVVSGAVYTSLKTYIETPSEAASYTSIILTIGLLGICNFEMNKTMGFKQWYYQVLLITLSIILFIFPSSEILYDFSFYKAMNLTGATSWFGAWQFPVLLTIYLFITMIIGFADKRINQKNALINVVMTIIIILALKAFSVTSLALSSSNGERDRAMFSFNTIVWIWLMIILSDSFQYLGGMRFGKTKLSPNISPKKTWEGALIGMGVASGTGIVFAMIFQFVTPLKEFQPLREIMQGLGSTSVILEVIMYILLSLVFPIIGLFGDLLFSWVKRQVKIKDYSNLIPGHGGALDRLDSIIFSLFILFIFISCAALI
ncbi:phosphatidate cytidylyltransferase [Spiroplasma diminutum]|uniref:Phosphatidate cytidylyltransferase n=1 Tax=Spiroplasma diminutum CUAS-1 TaxID=1276221 RepID=S5LWY3_9MOLU|nr:phosphatidate cytidylyltransferase [Spiroplasma diminutum]AGR42304.1 phosphatidate cytidylyltransferase [Spiroplasma diminutum CUAS-1]